MYQCTGEVAAMAARLLLVGNNLEGCLQELVLGTERVNQFDDEAP